MAIPRERAASADNISNKKKRKYYNNNHQHNGSQKKQMDEHPKHTGPGFLLSCERGREHKCRREGQAMLDHYYATAAQEPDYSCTDSTKSNPSVVNNGEESVSKHKPEGSTITSLDDELELLRKQGRSFGSGSRHDSSSSFVEVETGCKGLIYIAMKTPVYEQFDFEPDHATAQTVHSDQSNARASEMPAIENPLKAKSESKLTVHRIDFIGRESTKVDADPNVEPNVSGPQEDTESSRQVRDGPEPTQATIIPLPVWDPIPLLELIVQEIADPPRSQKHVVPSSRFVLRMIPIQVTCFAALPDIKHTVRALMQRVLRSVSFHSAPSGVAIKHDDEEEEEAVATTRCHDTTIGETVSAAVTSAITFAVRVKRRNCSHITSLQIIDVAADEVVNITRLHSKCSSSTTVVLAYSREWKVDLKTPDYTIWIEVCKTWCGVSIVSKDMLEKARNFNLAELRGKAALAAAVD